MAVTHSNAAKSAAADAVLGLLDAGVGDNGLLELQTSTSDEVATLGLSDPAFGAASSGVATANTITDDASAAGGTITKFELQNKAGVAVVFGSVTLVSGGGDIEMSSVVIGAGDTVRVTSLQYTAMP
jgi:hypothetical protein